MSIINSLSPDIAAQKLKLLETLGIAISQSLKGLLYIRSQGEESHDIPLELEEELVDMLETLAIGIIDHKVQQYWKSCDREKECYMSMTLPLPTTRRGVVERCARYGVEFVAYADELMTWAESMPVDLSQIEMIISLMVERPLAEQDSRYEMTIELSGETGETIRDATDFSLSCTRQEIADFLQIQAMAGVDIESAIQIEYADSLPSGFEEHIIRDEAFVQQCRLYTGLLPLMEVLWDESTPAEQYDDVLAQINASQSWKSFLGEVLLQRDTHQLNNLFATKQSFARIRLRDVTSDDVTDIYATRIKTTSDSYMDIVCAWSDMTQQPITPHEGLMYDEDTTCEAVIKRSDMQHYRLSMIWKSQGQCVRQSSFQLADYQVLQLLKQISCHDKQLHECFEWIS